MRNLRIGENNRASKYSAFLTRNIMLIRKDFRSKQIRVTWRSGMRKDKKDHSEGSYSVVKRVYWSSFSLTRLLSSKLLMRTMAMDRT